MREVYAGECGRAPFHAGGAVEFLYFMQLGGFVGVGRICDGHVGAGVGFGEFNVGGGGQGEPGDDEGAVVRSDKGPRITKHAGGTDGEGLGVLHESGDLDDGCYADAWLAEVVFWAGVLGTGGILGGLREEGGGWDGGGEGGDRA